MSSIDESRPFIPVNICVLTLSDTRQLADDKSGKILEYRLTTAGHKLYDRQLCIDDIETIRKIIQQWTNDDNVDVIITTGGTGFTGNDVTIEAIEPLFEKTMDGFSQVFHRISYDKIGTSTVQSRATGGIINATYVFCLPGSPGACKDGWDEIISLQLDYRYMPCNFIEIMPRLDEHLKRNK